MAAITFPNLNFPAQLPLIQAPMAGVQDSALAIAVARAGGVGSLPCAMLSPAALAAELETLRDAGVAAYNLNFFCHEQPAPDPHREARWRQALAPYYREYGIDPDSAEAGAGRMPFAAAMLEVIRPFEPPIVSFHFGLPRREWVDTIRSWGAQVWSSATTVDEALWLVDHGADAVIAQGIEAGGHRGMFLHDDLATQRGTGELLAAVCEAVSVPVIAAGGIASPGHVREALAAGAWAVQVGTAYLCCEEATTSNVHRAVLQTRATQDTQITNLFSGRPARGIANRLTRELGPVSDLPPAFPLAATAIAPLRAVAEKAGSPDFSPLWCGTDASGCRAVSAGEQTRWLASYVG